MYDVPKSNWLFAKIKTLFHMCKNKKKIVTITIQLCIVAHISFAKHFRSIHSTRERFFYLVHLKIDNLFCEFFQGLFKYEKINILPKKKCLTNVEEYRNKKIIIFSSNNFIFVYRQFACALCGFKNKMF